MINRVLIRVKVVQMLYSYLLTKPDRTFEQALKDLHTSFEKSYDLYLYLLKLLPELTHQQFKKLDDAKHKFMPTPEELNPNTRFVDNKLVALIEENQELNKLFQNRLITWTDDPIFLRLMLDKIVKSEEYQQYMEMPRTDLESDSEIWRQILRKIILEDENLEDQLESRSLYLSCEDLHFMVQFVLKTINRLVKGDDHPILPMYKDKEDSEFGELLFSKTIRDVDDNNVLIDSCITADRWDRNRVALMDRVIMSTAITELKCFDNIPVLVTLNEYIELAKIFSTPNSGQFVNGVLNAVVQTLRSRGRLVKP